jgi:hypothetical protein
MQLGLILTLVVVYAFFEHRTEIENYIPQKAVVSTCSEIVYTPYEFIEIEREVVKQTKLLKVTSLESLIIRKAINLKSTLPNWELFVINKQPPLSNKILVNNFLSSNMNKAK